MTLFPGAFTCPSLTASGRDALTEKLRVLCEERRPELQRQVLELRTPGDPSENPAYLNALQELRALERQILDLHDALRHCRLIEAPPVDGIARLGSTVVVADDLGETEYRLVGSLEADPVRGRISDRSPVGAALIGARPGDTLTVTTPAGARSVRVVSVR